MEQLERLVERELEVLTGLPAPAPRSEALDRVKAAVRVEAGRLGRPAARMWVLPRGAGLAAAVLLAVGLSGIFAGSLTPTEPRVDAADLLAAWADAVGDSSDQLAFLLDEGWMLEEAAGEGGEPIEGLLDSLDKSFEQFGAL